MTCFQIKELIDSNNKKIESLLTTETFVLNKQIRDLLMQNQLLQEECTHSFEKGQCKYCYKGDEE